MSESKRSWSEIVEWLEARVSVQAQVLPELLFFGGCPEEEDRGGETSQTSGLNSESRLPEGAAADGPSTGSQSGLVVPSGAASVSSPQEPDPPPAPGVPGSCPHVWRLTSSGLKYCQECEAESLKQRTADALPEPKFSQELIDALSLNEDCSDGAKQVRTRCIGCGQFDNELTYNLGCCWTYGDDGELERGHHMVPVDESAVRSHLDVSQRLHAFRQSGESELAALRKVADAARELLAATHKPDDPVSWNDPTRVALVNALQDPCLAKAKP